MYKPMSASRGSGGVFGAVQRDEPDVLEKILGDKKLYGADDLAKALHIAAEAGNEECTRILLNFKANPNIHDNSGLTPLVLASKRGHFGTVRHLLTAGCKVNKATFRIHATALHWAATNGHLNCVRLLLENGANPESLTVHRRTPLMLAARNDQDDIVQYLIESGANVNSRDYSKTSALHLAAEEGSLDSLRELVRGGADINAKTKFGDTPLILAARKGDDDVVRELLAQPGLLTGHTSRQLNALQWAAESGHLESLEVLWQHGMDPNVVTSDSYCKGDFIVSAGVSALMLACKGGYGDCVELLLKYGAKESLGDEDGFTALHYAAKNDHGPCVYQLCRFGANPDCSTGSAHKTESGSSSDIGI